MSAYEGATYWQEAFEYALDDEGLFDIVEQMTPGQRAAVGKSLAISAECQSQVFYTPPPSDRISEIERKAKDSYAQLEAEFTAYRQGAERAVGRALGQFHDASISITPEGDVFRHGGRTEQIA